MTLLDRIGIDFGRRMRIEEAIEWAARHQVRFIDMQLDTGDNRVDAIDDARAAAIRAQAERAGVTLGLHTLSAVNVAEYSPFLSDAVDAYMRAYIDVAPKLGAAWIVVHAGYHFTADVKPRREAGLERLKRMVEHAEKRGALLLLENLNKEPADAEVHYLAHTIEEWRYYYEAIHSPDCRARTSSAGCARPSCRCMAASPGRSPRRNTPRPRRWPRRNSPRKNGCGMFPESG
jgi:sugar phosphate isomerase/epimerase